MTQFINYKKRDVTLPPGCKDLIDLLKPDAPAFVPGSIPPDEQPSVTRGEAVQKGLSEIHRYVERVFHAGGEIVILLISTGDEELTVNLSREGDRAIRVFVVFRHEAARESAMRAFLERHGLEIPRISGMPEHFSPDIPVECIYPMSPLRMESRAIADLTTELFLEVCSLDDNAELHFRYYEV